MIGFIAPFQILDYVERLNVVKETSREYHCLCPVCGDGGFKIDKKEGKYQGFKCGCNVKDIREAIRPWSEVKETQPNRKNSNQNSKSAKSNSQIKLARLDSSACEAPVAESKSIPNWLVKQGIPSEAVETRYWYSKTQWVSRFEWSTFEGKEKRSEAVLGVAPMSHRFKKTIRQGHIKSNGLIQWRKGDKNWLAYKLTEAAKHCTDKWVLGVEGEGCVETAREIGLSTITWQGSNWKVSRIVKDLTILIDSGAAGLVYFPDRDEVGEKKAELVKSACEQVNLPCLILSPTDVWAEMPEKGDITDWVEALKDSQSSAHPSVSTNKLVPKLESAAELAHHRQGLIERRFSNQQIEQYGFKSVSYHQTLSRTVNDHLAGVAPGGKRLTNKFSGLIVPIRDSDGHYLGWQYRLDPSNNCRYLWASSEGISSHVQEYSELPLAFCFPDGGVKNTNYIALTEGIRNLGYTVAIAWWGQINKSHPDQF